MLQKCYTIVPNFSPIIMSHYIDNLKTQQNHGKREGTETLKQRTWKFVLNAILIYVRKMLENPWKRQRLPDCGKHHLYVPLDFKKNLETKNQTHSFWNIIR